MMQQRALRLPLVQPGANIEIVNDLANPQASCRELLAAIILQAKYDDMSRVVMGIEGQHDQFILRVFGPKDSPNPQWWDLCPPPVSLYPMLFQWVVLLTKFEPGIPLKGWLTTIHGRDCEDLRVELTKTTCFELRWG